MERVLSQDERIRRAEEIYARRQTVRERTSRATVNIASSPEHKNLNLFKKLILQALICLLIYFIFYLINTTNYSFSKTTLEKTEELLSQEVDFMSIYNNIANSIASYISGLNLLKNDDNASAEENIVNENIIETNDSNQVVENEIQSNSIEEVENSEIKEEQGQNIALINNQEDTSQEEIKDVELSETDRIKQKYSFIVPVKRMDIFGIWRERINIKHCIYIS